MKRHMASFWVVTTLLMLSSDGVLHAAQDATWRVGYHVEVLTADGEPANDMMGSGATLGYRLGESYWGAISFEYIEYDFQSPHSRLGLQAPRADVDVRTRLTLASLSVEREWCRASAVRPFVGVLCGIGYAKIDGFSGSVGDVVHEVNADGGIEFVPACVVGIRYTRANWMLDGGVKAERHVADWELADRVAGRTEEIDDYTAWGGWIGLSLVL